MRKPEWNEIGMIVFAAYMWFTLTIDANLFISGDGGKSDEIYQSYIGIFGSQQNLAWFSLFIAVLVFISLYTRKYSFIIIVSVAALAYFLFITASFLINYPNIAFGIMSLVAVYLVARLYHLIDLSEEEKKEKILLKSEYHYNEEQEGREKQNDNGQN